MIEWLENYLVPDEKFKKAYEAVGDKKRAIIKTSIAKLFDTYLNTTSFSKITREFKRGLGVSTRFFPCDWGLILTHDTFCSCSQIVAVSVAAVMSEVKELYFVRIAKNHNNLNNLVLVGLELCGCNMLCSLSWERFNKLIDNLLKKSYKGFLIVLGNVNFLKRLATQITNQPFMLNKTIFLKVPEKGAILSKEKERINKKLINCFNPHLDINVLKHIDRNNYLKFEVVYTDDVMHPMLDEVPYVYGPGEEGFWIWKELNPLMLKEKTISIWKSEPWQRSI